jgi:hypothetical protein
LRPTADNSIALFGFFSRKKPLLSRTLLFAQTTVLRYYSRPIGNASIRHSSWRAAADKPWPNPTSFNWPPDTPPAKN